MTTLKGSSHLGTPTGFETTGEGELGDNISIFDAKNVRRWTEQENDDLYKDLLPRPVFPKSTFRVKAWVGHHVRGRES